MDEDHRHEVDTLKRANEDILDASDGEYETEAAIFFIQRNRGIDKETISRVLEANYRFMDERGFLDENWGAEEPAPSSTASRTASPASSVPKSR